MMRALVLALFGAATVSGMQPPGKSEVGVVATVTATGCLQRWTAPPGNPDGQAPSGVEYVLTHVDGVTRSATAAGGGVAEKTPTGARYLLLPHPTVSPRAHLDQRVRIVGTIAPQPSAGASPRDQLIDPSSSETNLPASTSAEPFQENIVEVAHLTVVAKRCGH